MSLRFAFVVLILIVSSPVSEAAGQDQARILVASSSDFITGADRNERRPDGFSSEAAEAIREGLARSGRYQVVEREAFRRVIDEQNVGDEYSPRLAQSVDGMIGDLDRLENMRLGGAVGLAMVLGSSEAADVAEALSDTGSAVGADYILIGRYDENSSVRRTSIPGGGTLARETINATLTLRLIKVSDSTLAGATSLQASASGPEAEQQLQRELSALSVEFVNDSLFPVQLLSMDPLVVNRGTNSGWSSGDLVTIFEEGQEIRDRGIVIGRLLEPVAETEVVSVQNELATLASVSGLRARADYAVSRSASADRSGEQSNRGAIVGGGASDGYRVAVSRLNFQRGCCRDVDGITPAIILDLIEQRLDQAGRFELVDRRQLNVSIEELDLQSALQGEALDTTGMIGADYLVIGRIDEISVVTEQQVIRAVGRTVTTRTGFATGTFYLIDVATGVVEALHRVEIERSGDAIRNPNDLGHLIALDAVRGLFAEVIPFEIVGVVGDEIYLSQGENWGVQVGEIYEVISLGREMFGSDGRSFGRAEQKVGEVRIQRVQGDRSVGRLVSGIASEGNRVRAGAVSPEPPQGPAMADEDEW